MATEVKEWRVRAIEYLIARKESLKRPPDLSKLSLGERLEWYLKPDYPEGKVIPFPVKHHRVGDQINEQFSGDADNSPEVPGVPTQAQDK